MAGLHVLLESKAGKTEQELLKKAEQAGIKVYGLSSYFLAQDERQSHTVILGYANLTPEQIEEGIQRLNQAWR